MTKDAQRTADPRYSCRVCSQGVPASQAVACTRCASPYHPDCWDFIGSCATFGCGGAESRSFDPSRDLVQDVEVRVEGTAVDRHALEVQRRRALGWLRRTGRTVPRTLLAGIMGSVASYAVFYLLIPGFGMTELVAALIFGVGIIHGLLAPFLAPLQVQTSRRTLIASGSLTLALMALGRYLSHHVVRSGFPWLPWVLMIGFSSVIFGSTLAEAMFGRRQTDGTALETVARPLRYLTSGLGCGIIILLSLVLVEQGPIPFRWVQETLPFMLTAIFCAGHPLETGKQAFLESYDPPPRLPSPDPGEKKMEEIRSAPGATPGG